ncbi:MAG: hypothetical protein Q4A03_05350 [Rothia sp. (in: high G+C Gram-positive bacteria)]|uniref:hypothetical protein n=1 Tax=Rothia sp. (in: high G+C Gram-positive bacteria) TaxID=1885016 RepID=UPI0027018389|nr:hypothetical protein [Rothia sp. (in: high G+C Gram-positive bacteria)]
MGFGLALCASVENFIGRLGDKTRRDGDKNTTFHIKYFCFSLSNLTCLVKKFFGKNFQPVPKVGFFGQKGSFFQRLQGGFVPQTSSSTGKWGQNFSFWGQVAP